MDCLEDSAVDLHEAYFVALRTRVEELKPILLKISRRETIINERIELEHLQMNPERLTARGPNAREERKREEAMTNRVKTIEKLTKEVSMSLKFIDSVCKIVTLFICHQSDCESNYYLGRIQWTFLICGKL